MEKASFGLSIEIKPLFAGLTGGSFVIFLTSVDGIVGVEALSTVTAEIMRIDAVCALQNSKLSVVDVTVWDF